jgi:hypothetical protein
MGIMVVKLPIIGLLPKQFLLIPSQKGQKNFVAHPLFAMKPYANRDFEHFWGPPMSYLHEYPAEGCVPKDNVAHIRSQ